MTRSVREGRTHAERRYEDVGASVLGWGSVNMDNFSSANGVKRRATLHKSELQDNWKRIEEEVELRAIETLE